jgi:hypothetical protein
MGTSYLGIGMYVFSHHSATERPAQQEGMVVSFFIHFYNKNHSFE